MAVLELRTWMVTWRSSCGFKRIVVSNLDGAEVVLDAEEIALPDNSYEVVFLRTPFCTIAEVLRKPWEKSCGFRGDMGSKNSTRADGKWVLIPKEFRVEFLQSPLFGRRICI